MSEPQSQSSLNLRGVRVCSGVQAEPGPGSNYFDVDEYCLWNTIIGHDNCNDRSISKCVSPFTRSRDLISSSAADASSDAYLLLFFSQRPRVHVHFERPAPPGRLQQVPRPGVQLRNEPLQQLGARGVLSPRIREPDLLRQRDEVGTF